MPHPPLPPAPCGLLPAQLRVLSVTADEKDCWSPAALAADSAIEITLVHASGGAVAMQRLGEQKFDAVIVLHAPPLLDAFQLLDAIFAGYGAGTPVLIAGHAPELQLAAHCFEAGAEAYLYLPQTSTRALYWHLARAVERRRLIAENRRYAAAEDKRLTEENREANRLLSRQRQLIDGLETVSSSAEFAPDGESSNASHPSDTTLSQQYQQLLQCSVMAGLDAVQPELTGFASQLAGAGVSGAGAMNMHLQVLGEMLEGLGPRSARHVIGRGDQLILKLMTQLASNYGGQARDAA